MKQIQNVINQIQKTTEQNPLDILLLNKKDQVKKTCAAVGLLDNNYYFGLPLQSKVPYTKKNKETKETYTTYKYENCTTLILSNKQILINHPNLIDETKLTIDGNIVLRNSRWNSEHLQNWLTKKKKNNKG